jgi:hypothetical protein
MDRAPTWCRCSDGGTLSIGLKLIWNSFYLVLLLPSLKRVLPDSIMVVRQFLVLFVLVRIQVGQQKR